MGKKERLGEIIAALSPAPGIMPRSSVGFDRYGLVNVATFMHVSECVCECVSAVGAHHGMTNREGTVDIAGCCLCFVPLTIHRKKTHTNKV